MEPATLSELKAALPKAPADFILAQLEASATVAQAREAWLDRREAELDRRQAAGRVPGVEPLASITHRARAGGENQADDDEPLSFGAMVAAERAAGKSYREAVATVARRCPEAHHEFLLEANPKRAAALIDLRFDK